VDLSIVGNSIVGLAGPSGGGKSTLLRCIQGLEKPDSGTILCQGKVGFMFQDFQLFPHMTVLQNLLYAPRLKDKSVAPRQRAEELLTHLKIASKADSFPDRLSGGQKQRVALARCLMTNPNVLLCDEPTSGLDVVTTSDIVSLLQTVRVMGVTMVLASHDLDFLTQISDRIIFLKGGRILLDQDRRQQTDSLDSLHALYRTSLSEEE
jgi:polar amino acid transport system ATP-binding protein